VPYWQHKIHMVFSKYRTRNGIVSETYHKAILYIAKQ
jgi:hypothetical protein